MMHGQKSIKKTLHVSGILSAHHQDGTPFEFHPDLELLWSSILTLLGNGHQKPA
jgi:hypothetical protein